MRSRDLAQVGIRIVAVYLLAQSLQWIGHAGWSYLFALRSGQADAMSEFVSLSPLMTASTLILAAALIWISAPCLARLAAGQDSRGLENADLAPEMLTSCGLIVAGAAIFVSTLPQLIVILIEMARQPDVQYPYGDFSSLFQRNEHFISNLITSVLKLLLSLALILGARVFAAWAIRLRYFGVTK